MPQISDAELTRLKNAVSELSTLNQIANAINVTMSVDQITSNIVEHCRRRVKATQGAIFLLDNQDDKSERFKTFVRETSMRDGEIPFHLNQSLQGWMVKNKSILLTNDPDNDTRLRGVNFAAIGLKSLVAAPMLSRSGLIGLLIMFNSSREEQFNDADSRFLGIVGTQVSKVIENAKLFEREQVLATIEKEINIAKDIQAGFLPKESVKNDNYEVFGFNIPAKHVGGDYYDFIQLDEHKVFLSLGDISGKGLPAALVMSNAQAVVRSQFNGSTTVDLPALGSCLNKLICQFTSTERYITATFGVYDSSSRKFSYVNAGHLPPGVVRKDGRADTPSEADLVIGIMPGVQYNVHEVTVEKGELLYLYTDGVTEANNPAMEMFGEERFEDLLTKNAGVNAEEGCEIVRNSVESFRDGAEQSDDITVLALRAK